MPDNTESLRSGPMAPLLFRLSFPAALGMAVQASYSLVDAFFVGQGVGPSGIAAISMTIPLQMVIMAIAQAGEASEGASMISRNLGAGRRKRAERTVGALFALTLAAWYTALRSLGRLLPDSCASSARAAPSSTAEEYASVLFLGAPFFAFSITANNFVRAEGNASFAMMTMVISAGVNIMLDPLHLRVRLGRARGGGPRYPRGRNGPVARVVLSRRKKRGGFPVEARPVQPQHPLRKHGDRGCRIARQGAASFSLLAVNLALSLLDGTPQWRHTASLTGCSSFAVMPTFGIVQGLLPIVGFNYGAKQHCRVVQAMHLSIGVSTFICTAGALLFLSFPAKITAVIHVIPRGDLPRDRRGADDSHRNAPHRVPGHGLGSVPGHRKGRPVLRPLPASPGDLPGPPGSAPRPPSGSAGRVGRVPGGGDFRRTGDVLPLPERNAPPPQFLRKRR